MWDKLINRKKAKLLWVFSGPSGSGKTTLCQELLHKKSLRLGKSVSYTTRARKQAEVDKRDYIFISKREFLRMRQSGEFLEWQEVFGNFYGTSKKKVEAILAKGKDVVLSIDVKGALEIKRQFPGKAAFIFIIPPNEEALKRRLHIRGREGKREMQKRLKFAKIEISYAPFYDYIVVNDNLKQAAQEIESIIITKRLENVLRTVRTSN